MVSWFGGVNGELMLDIYSDVMCILWEIMNGL
jgi:hypothetical protein